MRLLVVEDEPTTARALEQGLMAEGYEVDVANDGQTGLWMARENDYGLIVLDLMLPGRNGYQVCADLRSEGDQTPILMLTAKDGDYDQAEGLDTGADDFLTKPFSFVVLNAHIRSLLRRGRSDVRDEIVVGDLVVDRRTRTCTRGDQTAQLTRREFTLLETLAAEPGRVFSKDQLLAQVWGPDFDGTTNVVEVYIGYLRRKIDKGFDHPRLATVHGLGYRMVP